MATGSFHLVIGLYSAQPTQLCAAALKNAPDVISEQSYFQPVVGKIFGCLTLRIRGVLVFEFWHIGLGKTFLQGAVRPSRRQRAGISSFKEQSKGLSWDCLLIKWQGSVRHLLSLLPCRDILG